MTQSSAKKKPQPVEAGEGRTGRQAIPVLSRQYMGKDRCRRRHGAAAHDLVKVQRVSLDQLSSQLRPAGDKKATQAEKTECRRKTRPVRAERDSRGLAGRPRAGAGQVMP